MRFQIERAGVHKEFLKAFIVGVLTCYFILFLFGVV